MDEQPALNEGRTVLRFGPDRRLTAAEGAGAVLVLLAATTTADSAGRLLMIGVAVILGSYAVTDLVFNPRIVACAEGVVLRAPFARATLSWLQIESIGTDTRQRLGLRSSALEVDAGEVLAQFSRRALGIDPAAAAAQLRAVAPRRLSAGGANDGSGQQFSRPSEPESERGSAQPDRGEDQHGNPG